MCKVGPQGHWAVSRYEDVTFVMKHHELFSSVGARAETLKLEDERLQKESLMAGSGRITAVDPPDHTRLRKLVSGAFTNKALARLEGRVRGIVNEYIDKILAREDFDMIADMAVPLPIIVIAEMLGVDPELRADFKRWSDDA